MINKNNDILLYNNNKNLDLELLDVDFFKEQLNNASNNLQNELVDSLGFVGDFVGCDGSKDYFIGSIAPNLNNKENIKLAIKWLEKQEKSLKFQLFDNVGGDNLREVQELTNNFVEKLANLRLALANIDKLILKNVIDDAVIDILQKYEDTVVGKEFINLAGVKSDLTTFLTEKLKGVTKQEAINKVLEEFKIEAVSLVSVALKKYISFNQRYDYIFNQRYGKLSNLAEQFKTIGVALHDKNNFGIYNADKLHECLNTIQGIFLDIELYKVNNNLEVEDESNNK